MQKDGNIKRVLVGDITDTSGAAHFLTERLGRHVGVDTIHKFVREGRLPAYMFHDGELVLREPSQSNRGKDLIFLKVHLQAMEPPPLPGNPNIRTLSKSRKKRGNSLQNP
jgi:hypothetical protein